MPDPDIPARKILKASLEDSNVKDWVAAYKQLDSSVPVQKERVEGVPMKFIPSNSRGDLILRKVYGGLLLLLFLKHMKTCLRVNFMFFLYSYNLHTIVFFLKLFFFFA